MQIRLTDSSILNIKQYAIDGNNKTISIEFDDVSTYTYDSLKTVFSDKSLLSSIEILGDAGEVVTLITGYTKLYSITIAETLNVVLIKQTALEDRVALLEAKVASLEG